MKNLREKLSEFTEGNEFEHYKFIESIRPEYKHTISRYCANGYYINENCILFALGLSGNRNYERLCDKYTKVANLEFINWVLKENYINPLAINKLKTGNYAIFLNEFGGFIHIAKYTSETRVVSKWGAHGKFEHNLLDVPNEYGSRVVNFKCIDQTKALEMFSKFCII